MSFVPGKMGNSLDAFPKRQSALGGTFMVNVLENIMIASSTPVPSVGNQIITPCPTPATDTSPLLQIVTPMSADAFDPILATIDLTYKYLKLASKIRNSFPIGDPNAPKKTTI